MGLGCVGYTPQGPTQSDPRAHKALNIASSLTQSVFGDATWLRVVALDATERALECRKCSDVFVSSGPSLDGNEFLELKNPVLEALDLKEAGVLEEILEVAALIDGAQNVQVPGLGAQQLVALSHEVRLFGRDPIGVEAEHGVKLLERGQELVDVVLGTEVDDVDVSSHHGCSVDDGAQPADQDKLDLVAC